MVAMARWAYRRVYDCGVVPQKGSIVWLAVGQALQAARREAGVAHDG